MIPITIGAKCDCPDAAVKHGCNWVISIQDFYDTPVNKPLGIAPECHQHNFFDDITTESARYSSRDETVIRDHPPKLEHLKNILAFFKQIPDHEKTKVFVHCFAGMCRSTAVTYMLNCYQLGPGKEAEALALTERQTLNTRIWPNSLMVELADELLERNGEMIKAFNEWKEIETGKREADEQFQYENKKHPGQLWEDLQKSLAIDNSVKKE